MADLAKEVKCQTNTEKRDDNGSNLTSKEQTRKANNSNEHSVNLSLKMAMSLLQSVFVKNRPVVLPVHLQLAGCLPPQVGDSGLSSLFLPASNTVSTPQVLDQHLNSQLPPSLHSCPFANIQTSALLENLLLSQPETLVYHTDVPMYQSSGTSTCLQDLIQSLRNSEECEMTGPNQQIPLASNVLPHEIVHPTSTPMISLIPPTTLLVPYPFLVPLPVPLPIPIPILMSLDSKTLIKSSGSTVDKSTQTLSTTISCCTSTMACPIFPESQDEVLDLSFKATQTKQEHVLSASPNSALDLSVVSLSSRLQNGRNTWTVHEGNGNSVARSKNEDYNGKIVHPTQTVIVRPTETVPDPLCEKRRGFSWDYMKADRSRDTGVRDSSRGLSSLSHPLCSEPHRRILNNKNMHFKRNGSQNMYGDTPPLKKQHLALGL